MCFVSSLGLLHLRPQSLQANAPSSAWLRRCSVSRRPCLKVSPQMAHMKGLMLECLRSCPCRWDAEVNASPHSPQVNGRSSECFSTCLLKRDCPWKTIPQSLHVYLQKIRWTKKKKKKNPHLTTPPRIKKTPKSFSFLSWCQHLTHQYHQHKAIHHYKP